MIHVLGVSMPRSGHHFFEMILKNVLGGQFGYCEFYEKGCCKSIPCTSKTKNDLLDGGLFLQKSHDFDFRDPIIIPGAYRIVQYRSPVPRSLSNYELYLRDGAKDDNIATFRRFLVDEALYFYKFYEKWIAKASPEIYTLSYEELTADPFRAVLRFFGHIEYHVDADQVSEGIAKSVGHRGRDNTPFSLSDVFSHRYASYPVLANFEEITLSNCPGYFPLRHFPRANADQSLIGKMFYAMKALREEEYDAAISFAQSGYAEDPQDPLLAKLYEMVASQTAKRTARLLSAGRDAYRASG